MTKSAHAGAKTFVSTIRRKNHSQGNSFRSYARIHAPLYAFNLPKNPWGEQILDRFLQVTLKRLSSSGAVLILDSPNVGQVEGKLDFGV